MGSRACSNLLPMQQVVSEAASLSLGDYFHVQGHMVLSAKLTWAWRAVTMALMVNAMHSEERRLDHAILTCDAVLLQLGTCNNARSQLNCMVTATCGPSAYGHAGLAVMQNFSPHTINLHDNT